VAAAYRRVAALKTADAFQDYLHRLGIGGQLPLSGDASDPGVASLAEPLQLPGGRVVGNRFCIQPMEGWDGTPDGAPTELVRRRWRGFGASGAKLIWGGEATAVERQGRANPNQLRLQEDTAAALAALRTELVAVHEERFGRSDDLLVGLQLTHSGRFCRPNDKARMEPVTLYAHPLLDRKFAVDASASTASDEQVAAIVDRFVAAGELAWQAGYAFVDVKHCHGYLGHEFLSAVDRPGRYGGSFENRTRFLREVVAGLRRRVPELLIAVRLSAFDLIPFEPGSDRVGVPSEGAAQYRWGFGTAPHDPTAYDLTEPIRFLSLLQELGIFLVNLTAGSPYYNPHIQRPALFPPSDGYLPPEDPLVGVARQVEVVRQLKERFPDLVMVGSGYSYLQEWLPHVAGAVVAGGWADAVGLGRMTLSYPTLPDDVLAGRALQRKRICRTFSDCTTAPRGGLISGCFPLDPFYKNRDEAAELLRMKQSTS
jgi:2,4-dienoyl-CoA reductase-like NADH-dependent reductase (Old Yellow Enzyme family)